MFHGMATLSGMPEAESTGMSHSFWELLSQSGSSLSKSITNVMTLPRIGNG
jgi:hypothetical protein